MAARMDLSVYQAAAGMNASSRWQEIIADNLAANQNAGFKRQEMSFSAVQAGYLNRAATAAQKLNSSRMVMPLASSGTNFQAGELRPTGISTDFAIEGPSKKKQLSVLAPLINRVSAPVFVLFRY